MKISKEAMSQFEEDVSKAKSYEDLMGKNGAIKKLLKNTLEQILEVEMTDELGYDKHSVIGNNSGNSRNGKGSKRINTDNGEIDISVPRDRKGEFEPVIVKKYERNLGPIEDKIISMYAKGMTVRDIQSHIEEIYGLELSPTTVSNITDKVVKIVEEWQGRPLESIYPIVFLDAIHYKVRDEGKILLKAAYTILGIDINGNKDMLGIWVGETEGANYWLSILTELKNRGVEDILIACVDGLKGFPEAIQTIYPATEVQLCVIHQIRNSLRYIATKDQKEFMKDLRPVYNAPTEQNAVNLLDKLGEKWGKKYPIVIRSWRENWDNLSTYFKYSQEIRTVIYTTNAVETLHRQFRKVTKTRSIFPNDEALTKILYLANKNINKKWTQILRNWPFVNYQFSIMFENRVKKYIS